MRTTSKELMSEKDPAVLWQPSTQRIANSHLMRFIKEINQSYKLNIEYYAQLQQWSINNINKFWRHIWQYTQPIAEQAYKKAFQSDDKFENCNFFTHSRLNIAENLLKYSNKDPLMVTYNEQGDRKEYNHDQLKTAVAQVAHSFLQLGVQPGDHIAAVAPNITECVIAMLAALSVGAVWSCMPPEYHRETIANRLQIIDPKLLLITDSYTYNGQNQDQLWFLQALQERLQNLEGTFVIPYVQKLPNVEYLDSTDYFNALYNNEAQEPPYVRSSFNHPCFIVFSSGCVHQPRAIVHRAGGVLLQHLKEHTLHGEITQASTLLLHARPGESMWYWAIGSLAAGSSLVLYDGSPYYPDYSVLLRLAEAEQVTHWLLRPSFLTNLEKQLYAPNDFYQLPNLATIFTAQEPLISRNLEYVYENIKDNVRVSSLLLTADTSCALALDQPIAPVTRGEFMHLPLGMDIRVLNNQGQQTALHQKGELVCANAFPSLPLHLLNDSQKEQYYKFYFSQYLGYMNQSDLVERMENATIIYQGRMQTAIQCNQTLIGVNEIYRHSQRLDEVIENAAVGYSSQGEEKLILFIRLRPKFELNEEIRARINGFIRLNATEDHVPWVIIQAAELPKTHDLKPSEYTLKCVLNHEEITNQTALANPQSLQFFQNLVKQTQLK